MSTPLRERPDAPLGTLIFRAGLLPAETIESALEEGVKTGKRLGEILTERGLISEVDLARLLAGQKGLEFVTLREQIVDPGAATLFTEEQARLFRALPYAFDGELPVVAIADPTDDVLMRNIREALGRDDARFVVTARGELAEISADVYSRPLASPASAPVAPEAEVEPASDVEPAPAAHDEALNGSAPADAEPLHLASASEPVPEPAAPEPEPSAFQVPALDELAEPEPIAAPEPDPVALAEPEPAALNEQAPLLQPEPAPVSEPEPPTAYEPPEAPAPTAAFPVEVPPEPVMAPEALRVEETTAAPETPPQLQPPSMPEPTASPEPVPLPQPAPEPPPPPYPPAASEPEPEHRLEPEPAPTAEEQPESPAPEPGSGIPWRMTIRLTNGERVEAGDFPDLAGAKQEAKAIMSQIADADQDEWPFVNGRFLKPDTIVSVDIAEHDGDDSY